MTDSITPAGEDAPPDWDAIADAVQGTCDSLAAIAEKYDVSEEDVDGHLSELNVEYCPGCGWWWEACEIDAEGYCSDCVAGFEAAEQEEANRE